MTNAPDKMFAVSGLKTGTTTAKALAAAMPIEALLDVRDELVEQQDATATALQRIDRHIDRIGETVRGAQQAAGVATAAPLGAQVA